MPSFTHCVTVHLGVSDRKTDHSTLGLKRKTVGRRSNPRTEPVPVPPHILAWSDFIPDAREDKEYSCLQHTGYMKNTREERADKHSSSFHIILAEK